MWHCERAGCSEPPTLVLSVDLNGRVIYWDPLAAARRVGTALCFAHASAVPAPSGWVVCDRRGPNPMILVPPVQPTPVLVTGAGEVPPDPSVQPDLVEWFETGVGWEDPLDGDDDNTVVVAARRPSRVQLEDRPPAPLVLVEVSEPADLRWDLGSGPADDSAGGEPPTSAILTPATETNGSDRPWWADPNELVDLSIEPGPQTPLLARAFRASGPAALRHRSSGNGPSASVSMPYPGDAEDDITSPRPPVRPSLPARVRQA